jgi:hypothetical protein
VAACRDRAPSLDRRLLRVIDCQPGHTGLDRDAETLVQDVDTPRNLTDIGIGFANALDAFDELDVGRVRVGLLSLSIVLSYVDRETTYRFYQTIARRIEAESYLGPFAVDAAAHDERTPDTLRRAVDGVVEGRRTDDGNELGRVRGLDGAGFYVQVSEERARLTLESARDLFGKAYVMWRCWDCGEMGKLEGDLPASCPSCAAPKEELYYWAED